MHSKAQQKQKAQQTKNGAGSHPRMRVFHGNISRRSTGPGALELRSKNIVCSKLSRLCRKFRIQGPQKTKQTSKCLKLVGVPSCILYFWGDSEIQLSQLQSAKSPRTVDGLSHQKGETYREDSSYRKEDPLAQWMEYYMKRARPTESTPATEEEVSLPLGSDMTTQSAFCRRPGIAHPLAQRCP